MIRSPSTKNCETILTARGLIDRKAWLVLGWFWVGFGLVLGFFWFWGFFWGVVLMLGDVKILF